MCLSTSKLWTPIFPVLFIYFIWNFQDIFLRSEQTNPDNFNLFRLFLLVILWHKHRLRLDYLVTFIPTPAANTLRPLDDNRCSMCKCFSCARDTDIAVCHVLFAKHTLLLHDFFSYFLCFISILTGDCKVTISRRIRLKFLFLLRLLDL